MCVFEMGVGGVKHQSRQESNQGYQSCCVPWSVNTYAWLYKKLKWVMELGNFS